VWAELDGHPDGICIDAEGAIWSSAGPRCLRVREGGEVLEAIELDRMCFACMLGGADRRILVYLAEKTGTLLPAQHPARARVLQWLMWQMANIGPMLGQANYFANTAAEKIPHAIDRYVTESARLIRVMEDQLGRLPYLAGDYSIADIATYPWVVAGYQLLKVAKPEVVGAGDNVARWLAAVGDRPAVARGMAVPAL
jgi:GSH-dependent disulfide-bond oxidoreductase